MPTGTVLRLVDALAVGPGRLEQLEIHLAAVPAQAPLAQRQRRRGVLRAARLCLESEHEPLGEWLTGPYGARLRARGVERLALRVGGGVLTLSAQLLLGGRRVGVTLRARPAGQRGRALLLALDGVRVHGFTPVPAPAAGAALAATLVAAFSDTSGQGGLLPAAPGLRVLSPELCELDPLVLVLSRTLPAAGYRLPVCDGVALADVAVREGRLTLTFEERRPASAAPARDESGPLEEADRLLLAGEVATASAAYRGLCPDGGGPLTGAVFGAPDLADAAQRRVAERAAQRLLSVLAAAPAHFDEALRLAATLRKAQPAAALLAEAAIHAERGLPDRGAACYAALSELPDNSPEELAAAALAAAELLLPRDPVAALAKLERAAAIPGGLFAGRAAVRLVEEYTREQRWQELANLEERLLSMVPAASFKERQRRHLRLALLYLERLDAPHKAEAELDKALRLSSDYGAAWELRARLFAARGAAGLAEALRSLDRAAELSPPEVAAEIKVRAGILCERHGDEAAALVRYRQAQSLLPEHALSLERLASLSLRQGHLDEARAAFLRIVDHAQGGEIGERQRRAALLHLSRLALQSRGGAEADRSLARGYLGRALALGGDGDPDVLLGWVDLEEAEGNLDRAEKLLTRVLELGERRGEGSRRAASGPPPPPPAALRLRRARLLLALRRPAEAANEAERLLSEAPTVVVSVAAVAAQAGRSVSGASSSSSGPSSGQSGPSSGHSGLFPIPVLVPPPWPSGPAAGETRAALLRLLIAARQAMGDTRGVREALERLVAAHPDDQAAQGELGRSFLAAGDLQSARRHLEHAGDAPAVLEALVDALVRLGEREPLRDALLALAPQQAVPIERAATLGRLAALCVQLGQRAEAQAQLQAALALLASEPTSSAPEARRLVGEAAYALQRFADARAAWEPLLAAAAPGAAALALRLAQLAERPESGGPDVGKDALRLYQQALQLGAKGQDAAAAWHGIVRVLAASLDPEAQIDALTQAAADPRTESGPEARADLFARAAELRHKRGQLAEALGLYERALGQDPRNVAVVDAVAALADQLGDGERLADALARKARLLSDRPTERKTVLGQLGALYAGRLQRRAEARDAYRQALALDPSFIPALLFFADDALERGDTGAALAHLKRLSALPEGELPRDERAEILFRLAQLHRRAGRHDESEQKAFQAIELRPDHEGALLLLEERYQHGERWSELVEILRRRADLAQDPLDRQALLARRARLLDEVLGETGKALPAYLDLVRLAPSPDACIRLAALVLEHEAFRDVYDVAPVLGRALIDADRAAEAVPILEFATGRGAGEPLFALLAEAYESLADFDRAADAWRAAGRTADPLRHARALERAGRLEEALALWTQAAAHEPELAEAAQAAALALARRALAERSSQSPAEAALWAERLLDIDPRDPDALAELARHRSPVELNELLSAHEQRLLREEAGALCLAAAQRLPDEPALSETRQFLVRRALLRRPSPEGFLLLTRLTPAAQRPAVLQEALQAFPGQRDLTLLLMAQQPAGAALTLAEQALQGSPDPQAAEELALEAARLLRERGDLVEARRLLQRVLGSASAPAGDRADVALHPFLEAALHEEVQLLLQALPESARAPLAPLSEPTGPAAPDAALCATLERLRDRGWASADELRLLASRYLRRGDHEAAARTTLRLSEDAEPELLLRPLEAAGHHKQVLDALLAFAQVHEGHARRLLAHAAYVAEFALSDRALAAELTERAAAAPGAAAQGALLYASAGSQFSQLGQRERGAAALQRALTLGGEQTSGVLMALGDYFFERAETVPVAAARDPSYDQAARHYRRAIAVGQVPTPELGKVRLRLAAVERRRQNPIAEEQELAAAVEAGAGVQAWPQLAALFRSQGESARLGAALLAWADYEAGDARLKLLRQAATLISPSLLPRVDDELTKLGADDDEVRDRILARLRQGGDLHSLAQALVRDVERSEGERRAAAARELAAVGEQLGDQVAAASAHRAALESSAAPEDDAEQVLRWLGRCHAAGAAVPADLLDPLRALLLSAGRVTERLGQLDAQADAARVRGRPGQRSLELLKEAARLCDLIGDLPASTARFVHLVAVAPGDRQSFAQARLRLRALSAVSEDEHEAAIPTAIVDEELRRLGPAAAENPALRTLRAEALLLDDRRDEAVGELEVILLRFPMYGPVHALLGALLAQSEDPAERERGLPHLQTAAYAKDVDPVEAGECALLAAELLLSGMVGEDGVTQQLVEGSSNDPQPLFQRAADLLQDDARPVEGLTRYALLQGGVTRALQVVDGLLRSARARTVRARLLQQRAELSRLLAGDQTDDVEIEDVEEEPTH